MELTAIKCVVKVKYKFSKKREFIEFRFMSNYQGKREVSCFRNPRPDNCWSLRRYAFLETLLQVHSISLHSLKPLCSGLGCALM